MSKLFGTAGIRGLFGKKVNLQLISDVCYALTELYPKESFLVGHDARTSSESLARTASSILTLKGMEVYYVGLCSFPVIANLTLNEKHSIAIFITASHNPPEYNGMKILYHGRELTEIEQKDVEEIIRKKSVKQKYTDWFQIKEIKELKTGNQQYIKRLKETIKICGDKRKIIVDCANGPMSTLVPKYLSEIGFKVISINSHVDGSFPGRLAEPTPENLAVLMKLCKEEKAMGVAFDGDGDRIALIDEEGEFIELSRANALMAGLLIKKEKKGIILVSIDTSTVVDKYIKNKGGEVRRYKLGKLHHKAEELLKAKENVIFAAEPWKPIFPKWGLWIDGFFGLMKILEELVKTRKKLKELMEEIPKHYSSRVAYYVKEEKAEDIYEVCKELIKRELKNEDKKVLTIDGLRIDLKDDSWILIRKSGTEPKIRLYYEAATKEKFDYMERIVKKVERKINQIN